MEWILCRVAESSCLCEESFVKLTCLTTVKGRMTSVFQDAT